MMKQSPIGMRLALVVLAALLALPLAPTASPVAAKNRSRMVTRTFRNPAPITIPLAASYPASATSYPSPIAVNGVKGAIRDVNVHLNDISHDDPEEIQVLLVGPGGQTAVVMAEIGGDADVIDVTLTLDDEAPVRQTGPLLSGAFRPLDLISPIAFNAPAPEASANAALSVFDGSNPNGTWRLFVQDAYGPTEFGAIEGWELEITAKVKAKKKKR